MPRLADVNVYVQGADDWREARMVYAIVGDSVERLATM
jgi:hypothetical protein